MVGNPNVGKSALFNRLTGSYVVVSNYPGTTVAVSQGRMRLEGQEYAVVDTPGMYTVFPITEEERVTRRMLMEDPQDVILHVVDAKNLPRMLPFTLQLMEAGLPVILVLNIMDEAQQAGLTIDVDALREKLGIPVIATVGISGKGLKSLREAIVGYSAEHSVLKIDYGLAIEKATREITGLMPETTFYPRATALLALQEDKDVLRLLSTALNRLKKGLENPVGYYLTLSRQYRSDRILEGVITEGEVSGGQTGARLDSLLISPWTGIPILLAVLYFGFYRFVGGFGAGTVVDFLEGHLFEEYFVPFVNGWTERLIPWKVLQDLGCSKRSAFQGALSYQ
jgi:ferrous iron transport protein B